MRLRIGASDGLLWTQWWHFRFHKTRGIPWPAEKLLASQKGLCSMGLGVSFSSGRGKMAMKLSPHNGTTQTQTVRAGAQREFSGRAEIRPRWLNNREYLLSLRTSGQKLPANISPWQKTYVNANGFWRQGCNLRVTASLSGGGGGKGKKMWTYRLTFWHRSFTFKFSTPCM